MSAILLPIDCTTLPMEYVAQFHVLGTDPPYSKKVHTQAKSCAASNGESLGVSERDFGFGYLTPSLRRWLARASNVVQRWSLFYSDMESTTWLRIACEAAGAEYIREIPWVRWSQPQLSGDRPPTGAEDLLVVHATSLVLTHRQRVGKRGGRYSVAKHWNGPGNLVALEHKSLRGDEKYSAEKPVDGALDLVSWFSDYGESWFDPCAGRATFGRACQILGRKYVGCEQLPEAFARGLERLNSPPSAGEIVRVERFIESAEANANALLEQTANQPALEPSRARARARLADAQRAREYLAAMAKAA